MQKIYHLALQAKASDDARQFLAEQFGLNMGLHHQACIYAAGQLLFNKQQFPAPVQIQKVIDLWKLKPLPAPILIPKQKLTLAELGQKVAKVSRKRAEAEAEWAKLTSSKGLVSELDHNLNQHTALAISDARKKREKEGKTYVGPRVVGLPRPRSFCVMGEMGV